MKPFTRFTSAVLGLAVLGAPAPAAAANTNFTTRAELAVRETYDSNVYIQDEPPGAVGEAEAAAAGLHAVPAKRGSWVTSLQSRFGVEYKPGAVFSLAASYVPELTFFHNEPSENYTAHRGALNLSGRAGEIAWDLANMFCYIDGSDLGPTFGRPCDIPAIGGIPLRDRREAFAFRNCFKATIPAGPAFVRPVATTYVHNFGTHQLARVAGANYTYENYIDRQEVAGGLDVGLRLTDKVSIVAGYRLGAQDQYRLLGVDSPYDSFFQRALIGVEGSPWPWLKLAVLLGPEFRDFDDAATAMYPAFDANEQLYYVDASVTFLPTAQDSITLSNRRYEQPAFSSFSMYEDITYDLSWKHKLDNRWTVSAGFRLYIGDWQAPVQREDWIYTPAAGVACVLSPHLSTELNYSYDWVESQIPNTPGREYTRHLASLGLRYTF